MSNVAIKTLQQEAGERQSKQAAPEPSKGIRVKVTFNEKLNPFVRLGPLSHADGWLRSDGLVRIDYSPERERTEFDHVLVPLAQVAAMAVYRDQG